MYTKNKLSLTKISQILNNDSNTKKKWTTTTISRIITNPKYKGYYCGHKKEVADYMTKKIKCANTLLALLIGGLTFFIISCNKDAKTFTYADNLDTREITSSNSNYINDSSLIAVSELHNTYLSQIISSFNTHCTDKVVVDNGLKLYLRFQDICNGYEPVDGEEYFDKEGKNGFDYAYRYPGMNKVLQSAGRVIRTAEDIGVVALLDERFLEYQYRRMFPREWKQYEVVAVDEVAKRVEKFWNDWL